MIHRGTLDIKNPVSKRQKWIFYPDSDFMVVWNLMNIIFMFYLITLLPYFMVFSIQSLVIDGFEIIIDVYFIVDILINFNLAFMTAKGSLVEDRKVISKKYLKSYFIIDFLTSIPLGWFITSGNSSQLNKMLRILKVPKLIRTLKTSQKLQLSNLLKVFRLGNLWRYKVKS